MRDLVNRNVYVKDYLLRCRYLLHNHSVLENMPLFSRIDSIRNVDELDESIKRYIPSKRAYYTVHGFATESLLYGHIQNLHQYAGFDFQLRTSMPIVEHGINFDKMHTPRKLIKGFVGICQGDYVRQEIRRLNKALPLFSIGPYIHYARDYYDEDTLGSLREKNGRTLLVFPSHSTELEQALDCGTQEFVDFVLELCHKSFDSLYVCVYWLDIHNEITKMFRERGAHIVSAGARFDPLFLHRLKTIISLSDGVVANDLGTNIGYAVYLEKDTYLFSHRGIESIQEIDEANLSYKDKFMLAFSLGEHRDENVQSNLYREYWGGNEALKSPNEIAGILALNDLLIRKARGDVNKLPALIGDGEVLSDFVGLITEDLLIESLK